MKFYVRASNGARIKAFSAKDAAKLAARIGGTVLSIPVSR